VSSFLHPVGPESPGVYWLRRLLVVIVVLLVLLAVRWLLTGRGGTPSAEPTPGTTSSSPATSTPTSSASSTPSSKPSASKTATATSTASGIPLCADSAITVSASTDAASYPVGATPRLRMRIQNTSKAACRRDIGAAQNELVITSGSTRVWSSDDCNTGGTPQVVTMQPQQSYSVAVTWLGRLSAKGCPANQPVATAGTYKLVGRNGDVKSDPAVFSLT